MNQTLLHPPFWAYGMALAVVVALVVRANRRTQPRLFLAAGALLLLALVWGIVDWRVQTDLDRAMSRTRQIAAAVNRQDWGAFSSLLDSITSFEIFHNRNQLVKGAKDTAQGIGLRSVTITSLQGQDEGSLITVDVTCASVQEVPLDRPVLTNWRFNYAKTADGLVLEHIDVLQSGLPGQVSVQEIRSQLQR